MGLRTNRLEGEQLAPPSAAASRGWEKRRQAAALQSGWRRKWKPSRSRFPFDVDCSMFAFLSRSPKGNNIPARPEWPGKQRRFYMV
jgi:hypothetical protein